MKAQPLRGNLARIASSLAVAIVLLLTSGSIAGQAAPDVPIILTIIGPSQPVPAGQTFLVTVRAEQATNMGAFEFGVAFNQSILSTEPAWMALTPFLGSTGRTTSELRLENPVSLLQPVFGAYSYGSINGPSGAGNLATIQFQAAAPGVTSIDLTQVQVTDADANILPWTTVAGNVTVTGSTGMRRLFLPMLLRGR
ncbi:MAG: hypothetical protein H6647_12505 [Anaerolineales bacterium]|nr:hypothetical protein [Anaerolineales bacterium]